jgi:hypothetical protein
MMNKMGVKELWPYLADLGIQCKNTKLPPGGTILIDAMMLLHAHHASAFNFVVKQFPEASGMKSRQAKEFFIGGAMPTPNDLLFGPIVNGERTVNMACMEPSYGSPAAGIKPPWIRIREHIVADMATRMTAYLTGGITPVLVWDPVIGGMPGTVGKCVRNGEPLVLRNVDKTYIYLALKALGIPSIIAWTEGEKVVCAAAQAGLGIVISGDTDCIILGAPVIACNAIPLAGAGALLQGAIEWKTISDTFKNNGVDPATVPGRMLDAAIFLGCDFCERLPKNGPKTLVKRTKTIPYVPYTSAVRMDPRAAGSVEYQQSYARTIEFFNVTQNDRDRAVKLINDAMEVAWNPNVNVLDTLGATNALANLFEIVRRGRPTPNNAANDISEQPFTPSSGATCYE